jgi:hypothetical protein
MNNKGIKNVVIYQAKNGSIDFRGDFEKDTIWGSLEQIADLFEVQKPAISKHLKNIYESGELEKRATVSILETVQREGKRKVTRQTEYYNLDAILSVGYRVNSTQATRFRVWATQTLKQHLLEGFTINKKRIAENYDKFMHAVADIKTLLPQGGEVRAQDVLELINVFASTWFSLDAYDKGSLPTSGLNKKQVDFTAEELTEVLGELKKDLVNKREASDIFGQERPGASVVGIVGNVLQSIFGKDAYTSLEEKAAHLLYFMVKNHPFVDGNKRSGALAFVWFLRKAGLLRPSLTPEALTALTLLVAESDPKDKDQMIGLVLLLLNTQPKRQALRRQQ